MVWKFAGTFSFQFLFPACAQKMACQQTTLPAGHDAEKEIRWRAGQKFEYFGFIRLVAEAKSDLGDQAFWKGK